ncbi:hypothetical protein Ddye_008849, partial [Dipteronia dyeriana]
RNSKVHSSVVVHDVDVISWAITSLYDFWESNTSKGNEARDRGSSLEPHWQPPSAGSCNINTNATIYRTNRCVGIGVIVYDWTVCVMTSSAHKILLGYDYLIV